MADMRVRLLGTGGPELTVDRQGAATIVEAGGRHLLFDVGRGMMQRAYESAVPIRDVTNVFLTHLHSDHICDMADFWITGWFMLHRPKALEVWGPKGTDHYVSHLQKAHEFDLRIRRDKVPAGKHFAVTEIEEGVVYDRDGVRVTSFLVDHVEVQPALGFRVDYKGHSVVLSGDTTFCPSVIEHSRDVDLLIHEVAAASPELYAANPASCHVIKNHATPEQAAEVFAAAKPRLAVFNHVIRLDVTDDDILRRTRSRYGGAVELGVDGMGIDIGDQPHVLPPDRSASLPDLIQRDDVDARRA